MSDLAAEQSQLRSQTIYSAELLLLRQFENNIYDFNLLAYMKCFKGYMYKGLKIKHSPVKLLTVVCCQWVGATVTKDYLTDALKSKLWRHDESFSILNEGKKTILVDSADTFSNWENVYKFVFGT